MRLEQAKKKIRNAWIAGVISGFLTLIATLAAVTSEHQALSMGTFTINIWSLIDVFWIFFLAFGIYMKSRVAAIVMFIGYLLTRLWVLTSATTLSVVLGNVLIGVVFSYFFFQGARGAIAYHRLQRNYFAPPSLPVPPPSD